MPWRLTVRASNQVRRQSYEALVEALDALEARGRELIGSTRRDPVNVRLKRFGPAQQVVARLELAGPERLMPSVQIGVDVRGDSSSEAFRGRVRRSLLEHRDGEDAFAVLRRELGDVLAAAGQGGP